MPPLKEQVDPIKAIVLGDSGSGKTGALASLARAGYKLRILDFDNGTAILASLLKNDDVDVDVVKCLDKMKTQGQIIVPASMPTAMSKGLRHLDNWKGKDDNGNEYDLGRPSEWGTDTILVLDSLSFFGAAALRYILTLHGRQGQQPWQSDWGEAMRILEDMLSLLYSDAIKCHVIVNTHVTFIDLAATQGGEPITKALPSSLGKALPPKIGRYFNHALYVRTKGAGAAAKKIIRTKSEGIIELKSTAFDVAPAELPLETGLAEYFRLVLGSEPKE